MGGGWLVPAPDLDADLPEQRIHEAAVLLPPGGAVTGWASLRLQHGNFFDGLAPDGRTRLAVPLVTAQGRRARDGVVWLQDRLDPDEVILRDGVRCTIAERAVFDAMRRPRDPARVGVPGSFEDLQEAVVSMDMAAAAEITSVGRECAYLAARAGWVGVIVAREALDLAVDSSRSPLESRVRVIWEVKAGLPAPQVNRAVYDKASGRLLGYADLLDEEAGLVGEVDGGEHSGALRRSRDAARDEDFRNHQIEVFRVTGADVPHPDRVVGRLLAARARARFLPPGRRTWTTDPPDGSDLGLTLDEILAERDLTRGP